MIEYTIDTTFEGKRIDKFIKSIFPNAMQGYICKLLRKKQIKVNKKKVGNDYILKLNDTIQVYAQQKKLEKRVELGEKVKHVKKIDFSVLFEDEEILVLNKPVGLVVHNTEESDRKITLIDQVVKHVGYNGFGYAPALVHRIDKDTSGVMVVPKTKESYNSLFEQFKNKTVQKTYIALVVGHLLEKKGIINLPIQRKDRGRRKVHISKKYGKEAITEYNVLQEYTYKIGREVRTCSLVELFPKTGRTHQIRIHMDHIGHSLLGDKQYGDDEINNYFRKSFGLKGQLLHAKSIAFVHPKTGETLFFTADVQKNFRDIQKSLQIRT